MALAIALALVCALLAMGCGSGRTFFSKSGTSTSEAAPAPEEQEAAAPQESSPPELEAVPELEVVPPSTGEPEAPSAEEAQAATPIEGLEEVALRIGELPQHGLVLGDPTAPVELQEYGDLQCPICRGWAEERLPALIEGPVAAGKVKLTFRDFLVIGPTRGPRAPPPWQRVNRAGAGSSSNSSSATRGPRTAATSPARS